MIKKDIDSINIWGYYGCNYGDNIMMEIITDYINNEIPKLKLNVYELYHSIDRALVNDNVLINKCDINNLNLISKIRYIKKISKTSINLWGGGTVFTDRDGDGFFRVFSYLALMGIPFGYISVGIGKMNRISRRIKSRFLLRTCSFCSLREEHSYKKAIEFAKKNENFLLSDDLVCVYMKKYIESKRKPMKKKYIVVSMRSLDRYMDDKKKPRLVNYCIELINNVSKANSIYEVVILPLDVRNDMKCSNEMEQLLLEKGFNVRVIKTTNVNEITSIIQNSTFHLSGRLHGSLVSELLGVPTVSIIYSNKMDYLYYELKKSNYIRINDEFPDVSKLIKESLVKVNTDEYLSTHYENSMKNLKYLKDNINNILE